MFLRETKSDHYILHGVREDEDFYTRDDFRDGGIYIEGHGEKMISGTDYARSILGGVFVQSCSIVPLYCCMDYSRPSDNATVTAIHPPQDEFLQLTGGVHSSNRSVGGGTTPTRQDVIATSPCCMRLRATPHSY